MGEEQQFKLPGSSYEEVVKIIRGYQTVGGEAAPDDVTKVIGTHPTSVSRNNGFLVSVGIIEGGRKKKITERGRALALALDHEMPAEISEKWRSIVVANEFLSKLISAVRIRKGMDTQTLQAHVAYSAGQPRTGTSMAGAGAVVDILKAAGVVKEEDGKLVATEPPTDSDITTYQVRIGDVASAHDTLQHQTRETVPATETLLLRTPTGLAITIQIQIQCSPADIEGLGEKIRVLIKEISESQVETNRE